MTYYKLKIQIELFLGRVSGDQFSPRTSGEGISIGGAEHSSHSAKAATNYKVNQDFPGGTFPRKNVGKKGNAYKNTQNPERTPLKKNPTLFKIQRGGGWHLCCPLPPPRGRPCNQRVQHSITDFLTKHKVL